MSDIPVTPGSGGPLPHPSRHVPWRLPLPHWLGPACLLLVALCTPAPALSALPPPVLQILEAHGIRPERTTIWVEPADGGAPLIAHNPDTPLNPASVAKLATTFAALDILGPTHRWRTRLYAGGPLRDGVLEGDLWIVGEGDPFLVAEEMWKLLGNLRRAGVQHIHGDLVLDASHYALPAEDPGAFDGQPYRVYNQPPHALLANFNAVTFEVSLDRAGNTVRVEVDPPLHGLRLENRLTPGDGACGGYRRGITYTVTANGTVTLDGRYPRRCNDIYYLARTALAPEDYFHALFAALWQQWGGTLEGSWRPGTWIGDEGAPVLAEHHSRPYGELIRLANKFSNNVMTRHFKLAAGAAVYGPPATADKGDRAIRAVMNRHGVALEGMIVDNAAGLSRNNRMTGRQVAGVLRAAQRHPHMPEFVSSLALAGLDGTARERFADAPEAGRMYLKTGYLEGVSAVAGYLRTASDRDLLVVVMTNGPGVSWTTGIELQDAVLRWSFQQ